MGSTVIKRSIIVSGHKTSISIEDLFWISLKEIGRDENVTLSNLVGSISEQRVKGSNLSSAIRVFVLGRFQGLLQSLTRTNDNLNGTQRAASPTHSPGPLE